MYLTKGKRNTVKTIDTHGGQQNSCRNRKPWRGGKKKQKNTGIKHRVQTCLGANPHGKLVYAGFPDLCAMLPDVAVAG